MKVVTFFHKESVVPYVQTAKLAAWCGMAGTVVIVALLLWW